MSTGEEHNSPPGAEHVCPTKLDYVIREVLDKANSGVFHPRHHLVGHLVMLADLIARNLEHHHPDGLDISLITTVGACMCHDTVKAMVIWQVVAYGHAGSSPVDVWEAAGTLIEALLS